MADNILNTNTEPADSTPKPDYRQQVTDAIIRHMEAGTAPFQNPDKIQARPVFANSGRVIAGASAIYLMIKAREMGQSDPRWCTFVKAQEQGWSVKTGERATYIEMMRFTDKDGIRLDKPTAYYVPVFHASQLADIPEYSPPEKEPPEITAEAILINSSANILHDAKNAYYMPQKDEIHLPPRGSFAKVEEYFQAALRELCHWTGHETRLDRKIGAYGLTGHAKEELRTEMATLYISLDTGIPFAPDGTNKESFVEILKNNKDEIFWAARDADRIAWQIGNFSRDQEETLIATPPAQDIDQAKLNTIINTNVPDSGLKKLTARQEYIFSVQTAYINKQLVSDDTLAKDMLLKGHEKHRVVEAMTKYSPFNKGNSPDYGKSVVNSILTPELQTALKAAKGKKLSA
jgi:antirestriction protein ArdC